MRGAVAAAALRRVLRLLPLHLRPPLLPPLTAAAPPVAVASAAPAAASDGKKVYEASCIACHGAGIAGAPKFGDKVQWWPRISSHGINGPVPTSAIKGKGINARLRVATPPLSDADVKAAVDYMVAAAK